MLFPPSNPLPIGLHPPLPQHTRTHTHTLRDTGMVVAGPGGGFPVFGEASASQGRHIWVRWDGLGWDEVRWGGILAVSSSHPQVRGASEVFRCIRKCVCFASSAPCQRCACGLDATRPSSQAHGRYVCFRFAFGSTYRQMPLRLWHAVAQHGYVSQHFSCMILSRGQAKTYFNTCLKHI